MIIKSVNPIMAGETHFKRKRPKDRIRVHEGGNLHLERVYASGGFVVSVYHNYATNKEETRMHSVETALERYKEMADMRDNSPEWVDTRMLPALLKATRAAQLQQNRGDGLVMEVPDELDDGDIDRAVGDLAAAIAEARRRDPALDEEMRAVEKAYGVDSTLEAVVEDGGGDS